MIDTTMIVSNNESRPKLTPAAESNLHFTAMYPFFSYFQKSLGKHDPFTLKGVQNKPNLNNSKNVISTNLEMSYLKSATEYVKKTNPIQTQYKAKQTQFGTKDSVFAKIKDYLPRITPILETNIAILKTNKTDLKRQNLIRRPKSNSIDEKASFTYHGCDLIYGCNYG